MLITIIGSLLSILGAGIMLAMAVLSIVVMVKAAIKICRMED